MILRRAAAGNYFIKTVPFPGAGISTYQVSLRGVEVLDRLGIREGDEVPRDVFDRLRAQNLVWTGGSGPGDPFAADPRDLENLLQDLKRWARNGSPEELRRILSERHPGCTVSSCITSSFRKWVLEHEISIAPSSIAELTFFDVYENFLSSSRPPGSTLYEKLFKETEGCRVLYHWMKWIAEVYRVKMEQKGCPPTWRDTVHGFIYERLDLGDVPRPEGFEIWRRPPPFIRWLVAENIVEWVFPEQVSPRDAEISLYVNGHPIPLVSRRQNDKNLWVERTGPVDDPDTPVKVECHYLRGGSSCGGRSMTFPENDILLWAPDGRYIDPSEPLRPTSDHDFVYLLTRSQHEEGLRSSGIVLNEDDAEIEPAGWIDWVGYRVHIPASTGRLGPYTVLEDKPSMEVIVPEPLRSEGVEFAHPLPVFLGEWPQIQVHSSQESIQVTASIGERPTSIVLTNPSRTKILDLNHHPEISENYGQITLRFFAYSASGSECVTKVVFRLPAWRLEYVRDPQGRSTKAVQISGVSNGTQIVPLEHCRIDKSGSAQFLISAMDPWKCPVVQVAWKRSEGDEIPFSIRLPVNRGAILESGQRLPDWNPLPLKVDAEWIASSTNEIRLQLMNGVASQHNRACSVKPSGKPACNVGNILGCSVRIPFHRLRDFFGMESEAFFIRSMTGWECFLELNRTEPPPLPLPGEPSTSDLAHALWNDNREILKGIWDECLAGISSVMATQDQLYELFLGSYLGDWRGIKKLSQRLDIPEMVSVQMRCQMRRSFTISDAEELRARIAQWPRDAYRSFADGEWWYRFHRAMHGGVGFGALETSHSRLKNLTTADPVTAVEAYCLASLSAILLSGNPNTRREDLPEAHIPKSRIEEFLTVVHRYFNKAVPATFQNSLPEIPHCFEMLFAAADVDLLRTCIAQIRREIENSRKMLDQLRNHRARYPFLFDLLMARQCRLDGDQEKALSIYRGLIDVRSDFILDEMYS